MTSADEFVAIVRAFEDAGARWELPLSAVGALQFPRDARRATDSDVARLRKSLERFDRDLVIDPEPMAGQDCLRALGRRRAEVAKWLSGRPEPLQVELAAHIESREGSPVLYELVEEFFAERGLDELESSFSTTFVSNPGSGEVVKGHAMVAAKLGLCPYRGKVPRDPKLFSGAWSRRRRAEHLLWRLALTQELWRTLGGAGLA